jgi:hypothetical protein
VVASSTQTAARLESGVVQLCQWAAPRGEETLPQETALVERAGPESRHLSSSLASEAETAETAEQAAVGCWLEALMA